MYIDEDLVTRFVWHEYMIFIVRLFEMELCEFKRVFCSEPDGSNLFRKLLCVGRIEFLLIGSTNRVVLS